MSKDKISIKHFGDAAEEKPIKGVGILKRVDNNHNNFEAEALKALETSLLQQVDVAVDRNLSRKESTKRVASVIDNLCSKKMCNLSEIKNIKAAQKDAISPIIDERDQALQDLRNTEVAFCDVHRKYERAKVAVENLKKNEELLKQKDETMVQMIDSRDLKFQAFKTKAEMTVENMYLEFQRKVQALENENAKLVAQLRRCEFRAEIVSSELAQRVRENEELNKLADELVEGKKTDAD